MITEKEIHVADLQEAAEKFLDDLVAQNMGGLMATFTPEGMSKAMALGQPPAGAPTSKKVIVLSAQGEDHPVDFELEAPAGQAVIGTVWREIGGQWKVNDIQIKKQP